MTSHVLWKLISFSCRTYFVELKTKFRVLKKVLKTTYRSTLGDASIRVYCQVLLRQAFGEQPKCLSTNCIAKCETRRSSEFFELMTVNLAHIDFYCTSSTRLVKETMAPEKSPSNRSRQCGETRQAKKNQRSKPESIPPEISCQGGTSSRLNDTHLGEVFHRNANGAYSRIIQITNLVK